MQSQCCILGVKWYDRITNAVRKETTGLTDLPSLIADQCHSLFGHICWLSRDTSASQALHLSIDAFTGLIPAADWKRPLGRPRTLEEDMGLPNSATACQSINPGPLVVEIATTHSRSSAAVSKWVIYSSTYTVLMLVFNIILVYVVQ